MKYPKSLWERTAQERAREARERRAVEEALASGLEPGQASIWIPPHLRSSTEVSSNK